jgi:CheY-like chemotaxis protein
MPEVILVADDEPGVRESLVEILRDAGYEVQAAADGTAAFAALDARDFGLVITDIRMPGAAGSPC